MSNINDTFFDGYYKNVWKSLIPEDLTAKEVDFMFSHFDLQPGNEVLDLMCGYGRHTIALARKGLQVTAIDNLSDYINDINKSSAIEKLPVKARVENIMESKCQHLFDLAICMGNSLNFFNSADTKKILQNISSCLNPNGHLLINSWSLAEIVFNKPVTNTWGKFGGMKMLTESRLLFQPTRIESEVTMLNADGSSETKKAIDYIYSLNEYDMMLNEAGLQLKDVFSIPGKKKFTAGEPRAYLIAQKN